jgi:hypothetical protein
MAGSRFTVLVKSAAKQGAQAFVDKVVPMAGALSRRRRTVAVSHRAARTPGSQFAVLRENEVALIRCLANLIVPYDDETPGAEDADAVRWIDTSLSLSAQRTALYAAGLIAIDEMAVKASGVGFVEMPHDAQIALLRQIETMVDTIQITPTLGTKLKSVATSVSCQLSGTADAIALFEVLVADVKQAFYTSEICWRWLEYDGPPMFQGYLTSSQGRLIVSPRRG